MSSKSSLTSDKEPLNNSSFLESSSSSSKDSSSLNSKPEPIEEPLTPTIDPNIFEPMEGYDHQEDYETHSRLNISDYEGHIYDSFDYEMQTRDKEGQCLICYESKMLKCFGYCFHFFCEDCLKAFFIAELNQFSNASMRCPSCKGYYLNHLPSELLSEEQMKKYEKLMQIMNLKEKEQLFQWCPTRKCEGYAIATHENFNISCNVCGVNFCYNCLKPWHNRRCGKRRGLSYAIWVFANNAKKCPKCKTHIQKNGGCPHMTCKMCGYEWCWTCGAVYSSNHRKFWCYLGNSLFDLNWWFIFTLILFPACFPFSLLYLYDMILQTEGLMFNDNKNKIVQILNNRIIMSLFLFIFGPAILALIFTIFYIFAPVVYGFKKCRYGKINLCFLMIMSHMILNLFVIIMIVLIGIIPIFGVFSIFFKIFTKLRKRRRVHDNSLLDDLDL